MALAIAWLSNRMAPRTDCSASTFCGGNLGEVRSTAESDFMPDSFAACVCERRHPLHGPWSHRPDGPAIHPRTSRWPETADRHRGQSRWMLPGDRTGPSDGRTAPLHPTPPRPPAQRHRTPSRRNIRSHEIRRGRAARPVAVRSTPAVRIPEPVDPVVPRAFDRVPPASAPVQALPDRHIIPTPQGCLPTSIGTGVPPPAMFQEAAYLSLRRPAPHGS